MKSLRRLAGLVAASGVGYVAGTLSSAGAASRLACAGDVDLRSSGSNNPGALNAAHQLGTRWGIAVLVADVAKGAAAARAGKHIAGDAGGYAAATMAIAGHIWPVWARFRGGKGVATSAGACLAVFPAYFPLDAGVAALGAVRRNAETSVRLSAVAWTLSAIVWWRRGWPNLRGPRPTVGLPLFAAAGSAMIVAKFAIARQAAPLTIAIGELELIEDRHLDATAAYRRLHNGDSATTSAPSPGAFATAYEQLVGGPIVSVHIGSTFSGTSTTLKAYR